MFSEGNKSMSMSIMSEQGNQALSIVYSFHHFFVFFSKGGRAGSNKFGTSELHVTK